MGGRNVPAWQAALSMVATQVSAISLIGAPAFIALKPGGGLSWLQYEFAIPLAMICIMITVVPLYRKAGVISIYEYLEHRFGTYTRGILSLMFMASRGLATGVALLATSIVTSVCIDLPLYETVLLIGAISIAYTTLGGIKADIYSDIIQLIILWSGAIICLLILKDFSSLEQYQIVSNRYHIFKMQGHGLGDGNIYGFWPMLIGGFFLYLSYYGCDQSETQRLLTTTNIRESQKVLLINGLVRFPLVITYCGVGIMLIPFLAGNPQFLAQLEGKPNDFLLPYFLLQHMPHGLLGLIVAGIFAASMSSLDSALNSLSAVTWRDFIQKYFHRFKNIPPHTELFYSKLLTLMWGILCTTFALFMIGGPETVLVLVNKIGSAFYGPILATFWLGFITRKANQIGAISGLTVGVGLNILIWQFFGDSVSWLWWNPIGFFSALLLGYGSSIIFKGRYEAKGGDTLSFKEKASPPKIYVVGLTLAFLVIVIFCWILQSWLE